MPGMLRSKNRFFLKAHSWLVIGTGIVTLVLGLTIWYSTLKTRSNLGHLWAQQTPQEQSMLQERVCGMSSVMNSADICSSTAVAISTAHHLLSRSILSVLLPQLRQSCLDVLAPSVALPIIISISCSRLCLVSSVSFHSP